MDKADINLIVENMIINRSFIVYKQSFNYIR